MEVLDSNLILEKNKLAGEQPWLILLEVELTDTETIYLVRNTEDITFGSTTYQAFPFEVDERNQVSQGEIPTLTIRVGNPNRTLQSYLEDYDGLVGNSITLRIVSLLSTITGDFDFTDSGGFDFADGGGFVFAESETGESSIWTQAIAFTYEVLGCVADATWVTFTLGAPNPLNRRFPLYRYISNHCNWKFGERECNYTFDAVGTWTANHQYWPGDLIYPITNNGHTYRCTNSGKSSYTEPSWSTETVALFAELTGPVQWVESTLQTWTALHTYYKGDIVHPAITGDNLITNGDFTTDLTGWGENSDGTVGVINEGTNQFSCTSGGKSGNCLTVSAEVGGGDYQGVDQVIDLTIGKNYLLYLFVKSGTAGADNFVCNINENGVANRHQITGTTTDSWVLHSLSFTVVDTCNQIHVYKSTPAPGAGSETMLFDSISLYELNETWDHNYRATTDGISGETEPTWPTRLGGTVSEGSVTVTWVMNDCKRSLKNCRDLNMSDNFGGHPGLSSGGMKVV